VAVRIENSSAEGNGEMAQPMFFDGSDRELDRPGIVDDGVGDTFTGNLLTVAPRILRILRGTSAGGASTGLVASW